ncbi:MAG TPA: hypothetical protein VGN90_03945 [Pyrinomonadaceae bacterium]|nr:hypothetical protein [Pyrinomonadaceae bacterium]
MNSYSTIYWDHGRAQHQNGNGVDVVWFRRQLLSIDDNNDRQDAPAV